MKKKFSDPNITINKVYTKAGDKGYTFLVGGKKVKKNSSRICGFGKIDELNVTIGACAVSINSANIKNKDNILFLLTRIQNDLFNLGNMIATPDDYMGESAPRISDDSVKYLEENINKYNSKLSDLSSFVLPGGSEINVRFHFSRTLCRESERIIVDIANRESFDLIIIQYLNRLSDLLFVLSRYINNTLSVNELMWDPNFGNK